VEDSALPVSFFVLGALAGLIRSQYWYPRDVGFRAHTSGHFCVDKSGAKSTPDHCALSGSLSTFTYTAMSAKTRCRSNSLPTNITVTLTPFGAAEREDLGGK
jgi:hypothetical protein